MHPQWIIQYVKADDLNESLVSVCQFNSGHSHIVVLKRCWAVLHGGKLTVNIFEAAMEILKILPPKPSDFPSYSSFISRSPLKVVP